MGHEKINIILDWSNIVCRVLIILILSFLLCFGVKADMSYPVSCNYDSQDIRFVLKDLAGQANVNIVVDDNLQRRVSLKLENVPFETVLLMFGQAFGIKVEINDNIIIATQKDQYNYSSQTNVEGISSEIIQIGSFITDDVVDILQALSSDLIIKAFEKQGIIVITGPYSKVNLAKNAVAPWLNRPTSLEQLKSEVIKLNYIEPQDLAYISGLASTIKITVLNNIKTIIVSGNRSDVDNAIKLIKSLDVPPKVVHISVEILEINQGDLDNIGISLKSNNGYNSIAVKWDEKNVQQNPWDTGDNKQINFLDLIQLRPWIRASMSLLTEVNFLVEEGKAKVLAKPSLTSLENKTAKIHTGERYTLVLYQNNYQQMQYIDVGVQLEITPRVDNEGNITATLSPQVSAITGFSKEGYPRIATRQVSTTVRVKNGETLIIGGLVKESESNTQHGLPIVSELPVFRTIFGNKNEQSEKSELVIMVTLSLVSDN